MLQRMKIENARVGIIIAFLLLAVLSAFQVPRIQFSFDFEQFFPDGDEDLEFFKTFIDHFETDDNFLLIAVENKTGVFEQEFLTDFKQLTNDIQGLPHIVGVQSLTKVSYPIVTPFGMTTIPAIHIDQPDRYARDRTKILNDDRFVHNLITEDATALVIFVKLVNNIDLEPARELMVNVTESIEQYSFDDYHYLGRPNFQKELVDMQKREIIVSAIVSGLLVTIIMLLIFRKFIGITIAIVSIGLGMLYFIGFMGLFGRQMSAMAALYPVLMIIVGTSDVIHIMSKYIDELKKGHSKATAIKTTIKEIGLATLLTSVTTAIGFMSLLSSRIGPIREFGLNSAIGVVIAYITVVLLTTSLLSFFDAHQLMGQRRKESFWDRAMLWSYQFTRNHQRPIVWSGLFTLILCGIGISMISTNYSIIRNMPIGKKITTDFQYFEQKLTGFRPVEIAVTAQGDYRADDFAVIKQIDTLEQYLSQYDALRATTSITALYKSMNQMVNSNNQKAYKIPASEAKFNRLKKWADKIPENNIKILLSDDGKRARISTRIIDLGADSINDLGDRIDQWIAANTDPNIAHFQRTGTGLIIDKNAEYVRRSLLLGLGMAIVIVSILMVLLFRNFKLLLISLIPNIIPLLIAGALLGYVGIELEAGISIVFAVIFGIAVDDTIHFLSKFKLAQNKGHSIEESLKITFQETGKAICLTTVILFFGFLVMLFSINPPSVIVGTLISITLFSALISDLLFIPPLMRFFLKDKKLPAKEAVEVAL